MERKIVAIVVLALMLSSGFLSFKTTVRASPKTWFVPGDFSTIQGAIDASAPGDTISVGAGTYNEQVVVDKSLIMIGSSADTTFIDGTGLTLTQSGLVTITSPGDVAFRGFTIRNAPVFPGSDDLRICLLTQSGIAGPTYTISYNKIYGSNNPDEWNDYGFYASQGKENILFTHNLVTGTSNNNIVLEQHTGSTEISYNTLDAGVWGTDAIFFMTYGGVDVNAVQNVSYNNFDMGTGGPFDYDHRATGVSFCSTAPKIGNPPEAKFTNMVVSGNTFNNLQSNRRGIGFWIAGTGNDLVSPTITGNTITGIGQPTNSSGIDFVGSGNVSGASITGNTITGTAAGIILRSGDASSATLNYNNIFGNTIGVNWTGGSAADVRFNWWGDPTGPSSPANPSGKGDIIAGTTIIEPWLITSCPPVNPVKTLIYVDPSNIQYWTISQGKTFDVNVKLIDVSNLWSFEFKLYWSNTLMTLMSIKMTLPWSAYYVGKYETNATSFWLGASAVNPAHAFSGNTTLATLTFQVACDPIYPQNAGCTLDLTDTILVNPPPTNSPIPHMTHTGTYTVFSTKPSLAVNPSLCIAHGANPGYVFSVNVTVSNIVNLYNFTFYLSYDSTLLVVTNYQLGPFLNHPVTIDSHNGTGLVWFKVSSTSPALPASGSGVLATITFRVIKGSLWKTYDPGVLSCMLHLYDTKLTTDTGLTVPAATSDGTYNYVPIQGDLDKNGHVDIVDLRMIGYYYDPAYNSTADINGDGKVNVMDLGIVGYYYGR